MNARSMMASGGNNSKIGSKRDMLIAMKLKVMANCRLFDNFGWTLQVWIAIIEMMIQCIRSQNRCV